MGAHPRTTDRARLRIADNQTPPTIGVHPRQPGALPPGGAGPVTLGHIEVAGVARAATLTPPVRRKSSTGGRVHPRTPMDSTSATRPTTQPRNPGAGILRTPHCGQPDRHHQQWGRTHEFLVPARPRTADNRIPPTIGAPHDNSGRCHPVGRDLSPGGT